MPELPAARGGVASRRRVLLKLAVAALLATAGVRQAHAQLLDRYFPANVPAYQDWAAAGAPLQDDSTVAPLGIRVGDVVVRPGLTERAGYDSNPFLGGAGGSGVVNTQANVSADTDWSRDAIDVNISANDTRFLAFPHQSFTDWTAAVGTVVDWADTRMQLGYAHLQTVTLPTSIGSFGFQQPIADRVDDVRFSDTIGAGRIGLVPALVAQTYRFSSAPGTTEAAASGAFNRDAVTASLTGSYDFSGGHNLLAIISDSVMQYPGGNSALKPADYNDVSALVGIEYRQSAILSYRALVGYEDRVATSRGTLRETITSPAAELDLIYKPTVLTTVTFKVAQSLQNEPTGLAQGLTETTASVEVVHALTRTVRLLGSAEYLRAQFPQGGETQSSETAHAGATWRLTRNLWLSADYDFLHTGAAGAGSVAFSRQQIYLGVRIEL